jgi:uncharacterized repeat protein (TIGR03847 family)
VADPFDFDLDPVTFITVGTEGPPGERTFYLQASKARETVSLVIEKEHAAALALSIQRLLGQQADKHPGGPAANAQKLDLNMDLLTPVEPAFRVGQLGIGVDEERDVVVLLADEYTEEAEDEPDAERRRARFVAGFDLMLTLARHALHVVNQGRPTCALCGEPIGPEGHFCARRNGHPPTLTV